MERDFLKVIYLFYIFYIVLLLFLIYKWNTYRNRLKYLNEEMLNMIHDLKNYGVTIKASGQLLKMSIHNKDEILRKNIYKHVDLIEKNFKEINFIIENFIQKSKSKQGGWEINRKEHDIVQTVKFVVESVSSYAEKKNLNINFYSQWSYKALTFDKEKTKTILLNLLINAIKYSKENNDIQIYLKLHNNFIEIAIKDKGEGIEIDEIPFIFNKYYRSKSKITKVRRGFGIGLYTSKFFAKIQGGDLIVHSIKGEGSTFSLLLPLYPYASPNVIYNNFNTHIKKL